jgi:hypothetical protein
VVHASVVCSCCCNGVDAYVRAVCTITNMSENPKWASLGGLPDDPLRMPPPYWRSGEGVLHLQASVSEIADKLLPDLILFTEALDTAVDGLDPEVVENDPPDEVAFIFESILYVESDIIRVSDLAIFMAAIAAEDGINQFAVFNIHKDAAEAIEKLSPPDKLILVSALMGAAPVKGTAPFEAIRNLTSWRNAAAHGHCVDRPTRSLRSNHLILPEDVPDMPAQLNEFQARLGDYFCVKDYLRSISVNNYTSERSSEDHSLAGFLAKINSYRFDDITSEGYRIYPPEIPGLPTLEGR